MMNKKPRYQKVVALFDNVTGTYVPIAGETPVKFDTDVSEENIKYGVNVYGVVGNYTRITSDGAAAGNVLTGKKFYINGQLRIGTYGGQTLVNTNIKYGVDIAGVAGTFTSEDVSPAEETHILLGKIAFVNGNKITGTLDLTNLTPENIKLGVTINGVLGTYTGA